MMLYVKDDVAAWWDKMVMVWEALVGDVEGWWTKMEEVGGEGGSYAEGSSLFPRYVPRLDKTTMV